MNEKQITREAHAKINLTLDVTGRRADGYHTVEMVMQSVGLHDDVTLRPADGISLTCSRPDLPTDSSNLAFRAAELFFRETGAAGGCAIHIEKRIPVAAGLAGGSTNAAAVLRALDALYGAGLSDDTLCAMGLKLGADVPFCLLGGTMLAEGIGEKLTRLPAAPRGYAVLCKPPFAVSTKAVYEAIDSVALPERPDTAGMLRAIEAGNWHGVCARLSNVMEMVTAEHHPEIGEIRRILLDCGADGARMSGSGPTVYGLFSAKTNAETAVQRLKPRFADTFLTELV